MFDFIIWKVQYLVILYYVDIIDRIKYEIINSKKNLFCYKSVKKC